MTSFPYPRPDAKGCWYQYATPREAIADLVWWAFIAMSNKDWQEAKRLMLEAEAIDTELAGT